MRMYSGGSGATPSVSIPTVTVTVPGGGHGGHHGHSSGGQYIIVVGSELRFADAYI